MECTECIQENEPANVTHLRVTILRGNHTLTFCAMEHTDTTPLPPVREEVTAIEYTPGLIALCDEAGYTDEIASLPIDDVRWLAQLDGTLTGRDISDLAVATGDRFDIERFISVVAMLDARGFMDSPTFRERRRRVEQEFNDLTVRPAAFKGLSYPADPVELATMLDSILGTVADDAIPDQAPVAIIAPHIDLRVGGDSYGPAYQALSRSDASTFVVFGTSHRMSYDAFMLSSKDFDTPIGMLPTDREMIAEFRRRLPFELTSNDIAHRSEHSIEFQAIFIRHIFRDRDIAIVPILTGSLYEYVELAHGRAGDDWRLTVLYATLAETARSLQRKICCVAGADMSHIGRKFGDDVGAQRLLASARAVDSLALEHAARGDADGFLAVLANNRNKFRVCGAAPIYAALRTASPSHGRILSHDTWDEPERDSAVTFASMAFYSDTRTR